jgi:hypothetical protein
MIVVFIQFRNVFIRILVASYSRKWKPSRFWLHKNQYTFEAYRVMITNTIIFWVWTQCCLVHAVRRRTVTTYNNVNLYSNCSCFFSTKFGSQRLRKMCIRCVKSAACGPHEAWHFILGSTGFNLPLIVECAEQHTADFLFKERFSSQAEEAKRGFFLGPWMVTYMIHQQTTQKCSLNSGIRGL